MYTPKLGQGCPLGCRQAFDPFLLPISGCQGSRIPQSEACLQESPKRNLVVCPVPVLLPFIAPFPSLAQTLLPHPKENIISSLLRTKPTLFSSLPCGKDYFYELRLSNMVLFVRPRASQCARSGLRNKDFLIFQNTNCDLERLEASLLSISLSCLL